MRRPWATRLQMRVVMCGIVSTAALHDSSNQRLQGESHAARQATGRLLAQ